MSGGRQPLAAANMHSAEPRHGISLKIQVLDPKRRRTNVVFLVVPVPRVQHLGRNQASTFFDAAVLRQLATQPSHANSKADRSEGLECAAERRKVETGHCFCTS